MISSLQSRIAFAFALVLLIGCGSDQTPSSTPATDATADEFVRESLDLDSLRPDVPVDALAGSDGSGPISLSARSVDGTPLSIVVADGPQGERGLRAVESGAASGGSHAGNYAAGAHEILLDFTPVHEDGVTILQIVIRSESDSKVELLGAGGAEIGSVIVPANSPFLSIDSYGDVRTIRATLGSGATLGEVAFVPKPNRGRRGRVVGDRVFLDLNGNGTPDTDEPGLTGVRVNFLNAGRDGQLGTSDDVTGYAVTTDTGLYRLRALPPGVNTISVDPLTGPDATQLGGNASYQVELEAGGSFLDADFHFAQIREPGSIGGIVFHDLNDNGVQDGGESGIGNILLSLQGVGPDAVLGTEDDIVATTTTNGRGQYLFKNLDEGFFIVTVDSSGRPNGTVLGSEEKYKRTLEQGEDHDGANFWFVGERETISIGDEVFYDRNDSGSREPSEPGIEGVTLNLVCVGPDGQLGTDDDYTDTTVSDADGYYLFQDIPAGFCIVSVDASTAPPGRKLGCDDKFKVVLQPGEEYLYADFCFIDAPPAGIGDLVYIDLNGNGLHDEGEPGVSGVEVELTGPGEDGVLGTPDDTVSFAETGEDGTYLFGSLLAGDYNVRLVVESTPLDTTPGDCPTEQEVTVVAGLIYLDADFCLTMIDSEPGAVDGRVFIDGNGDGIQGPGEPGISNVTIRLVHAGPDGVFGTEDDTSDTTSTSGSGFYSFDEVEPGDVRVEVDTSTVPEELQQGVCPVTRELEVTEGSTSRADFCFVEPEPEYGRVIGTVFIDENDNGSQDSGEAGIPGVTVRLIHPGPDGVVGSLDDFVLPTVTDENGDYSFEEVLPGGAVVTVDPSTIPEELEEGVCALTVPVVVVANETAEADFCFVAPPEPAAIRGTVFLDFNRNGIQEPEERGIGGASIRITGAGPDGILGTADDEVKIRVVSADGKYEVTQLFPGDYRVDVLLDTVPEDFIVGVCPTEEQVSLAAGETAIVDFCFVDKPQPGIVRSLVFCDTNQNGVREENEPGIEGIRILLICGGDDGAFDTEDDVFGEAFSGPDGTLMFPETPAGPCRLVLDPLTIPEDKEPGLCPMEFESDLTAGGDLMIGPFCLVPKIIDPSEVHGMVFCDDNENQVQDGRETRMAGIDILLTSPGDDGIYGTFDDVVYLQTTDWNGEYLFTNLPADEYIVAVDESTVPPSKSRALCSVFREFILLDNDVYEADFCFASCGACRNYVSQLTLRYDGAIPAMIRVRQKNNQTVFYETVEPGQEFTFHGTYRGSFGTEVKISIDEGPYAIFDTSCDVEVGPGLVAGDFVVLAGHSKLGGPLCRIAPTPPPTLP